VTNKGYNIPSLVFLKLLFFYTQEPETIMGKLVFGKVRNEIQKFFVG